MGAAQRVRVDAKFGDGTWGGLHLNFNLNEIHNGQLRLALGGLQTLGFPIFE